MLVIPPSHRFRLLEIRKKLPAAGVSKSWAVRKDSGETRKSGFLRPPDREQAPRQIQMARLYRALLFKMETTHSLFEILRTPDVENTSVRELHTLY